MANSIERPDGITCPDWDLKYVGKRDCRYYKQGGGCEHPGHLVCVEWLKKQPAYVAPPEVEASLAEAKAEIARNTITSEPPVAAVDALAPPPAPDTIPKANEPFRLAIAPGPAPKPGRLRELPDAIHIESSAEFISKVRALSVTGDPPPGATNGATNGVGSHEGSHERAHEGSHEGSHESGAERPEWRPPLRAVDEAELARLEALAKEITIASDAGEIVLVPEHTPHIAERTELTFREAAFLRLVVDAFPGARVTKVLGAQKVQVAVPVATPPEKIELTPAAAAAMTEGWDE